MVLSRKFCNRFILHRISTPYAGYLFENKAKDNPDKNWKQNDSEKSYWSRGNRRLWGIKDSEATGRSVEEAAYFPSH